MPSERTRDLAYLLHLAADHRQTELTEAEAAQIFFDAGGLSAKLHLIESAMAKTNWSDALAHMREYMALVHGQEDQTSPRPEETP